MALSLTDVGEAVSDVDKITKTLKSLPSSFSAFISTWDSYAEDMQTLENLTSRLLREEKQLMQNDDIATAFAALNFYKNYKNMIRQESHNDEKKENHGKQSAKGSAKCRDAGRRLTMPALLCFLINSSITPCFIGARVKSKSAGHVAIPVLHTLENPEKHGRQGTRWGEHIWITKGGNSTTTSSENKLQGSRIFSYRLELALLPSLISLESSTISRPLAVAARTWEGEDMHPFKEAILDLLMVWKIQNPWMVILKEWMDIHPQGLILVNKVHVIRLLVIFSKGEKNNCPLHQLVVYEDRLSSLYALQKPLLNDDQRKQRAQGCSERLGWDKSAWQRVVFSDESRFELFPCRRRIIFRVLPPNLPIDDPYSPQVQNLLKMTNLRINFTKLHTLGDDLLDDRQEIQARCNCNNHATSCHFDESVWEASGHLTGGICDGCLHNTIGHNCEQCKPFYYQDPSRDLSDPDVCQSCECDPRGTIDDGTCESRTDLINHLEAGRCHCKTYIEGRRCDRCKHGYWNFVENNPDGCELIVINVCKNTGDFPTIKMDVKLATVIQVVLMIATVMSSLANAGRTCNQPEQSFYTGTLDFLIYEAELSRSSENCQVVIREPFRDGRENTWTGTGFMRTFEDSKLEFIVDNIQTSMEYDIVIRYEPQVTFF
uniref:Uncharacterized protein n=1 Tax=Timema tahoe TaxID=61484 RepID=A0A7R9ICI1_9NEOP|nr:unnamed protein product [Timema tahoe]